MESLPSLLCIALITLLFVVPMWAYINITERAARVLRDKAIEAGRHEPVTIQPFVDLSVCMGSGACVPACPEDVLKVIDGQAVAVSMSACIGHGACVTACPVGAIELVFGSEKRGIDIPRVGSDFQTNVSGVYIAGELGGMGLIANAADQGVRALGHATDGVRPDPDVVSVVIVGAGPAGIAAAAAAKQKGISYILVEQEELGGAVRHYPRKKLVFTRPMEIPGYGKVNLKTLRKEELVTLFEDITKKLALDVSTHERVDKVSPRPGGFTVTTVKRSIDTQRVILALGRRGTPRKLDVTGEDQEKVAYSLLEPEHYQYDHLMVVGGGDSAVEATLSLAEQPGNKVYLSYRGDKINRPKEKNLQLLRDAVKTNKVELLLESQIKDIGQDRITVEQRGEQVVLPNDYVFVMVGGVLPTKFLQDVGIKIQKHYGKRVEGMEESSAAGSRPATGPVTAISNVPDSGRGPVSLPTALKPELSFISAPGGMDDATMALPANNDEPTISLGPDPLGELLREPAPSPAAEPTVLAAQPRPASGLSLLGTRVSPSVAPASGGAQHDELPGAFDEPAPAPGVRREVTEIQPLRRVALPGAEGQAAREETLALPGSMPSDENTVPLPDQLPEGQAPLGDQVPGAAGRIVAKRKEPDPKPPVSPGGGEVELPASAISARLSRPVGAARTGAVRSGATGQVGEVRGEPRPGSLPGGARPRAGSTGPVPAAEPASPPSARLGRANMIEPFLESGNKLLAERQYDELLRMSRELSGLVERYASTAAQQPDAAREVALARHWVFWFEGEARLGRGEWSDAIPPLEQSVDAARSADSQEALGRALIAFGRACHHVGQYDRARSVLDEALRRSNPAPRERSAVLRLLGDQSLRRGEVDLAEQQWNEALTCARSAGSADAEGRAMRGLANCTAIRGHYPEALDQLNDALDRLGPTGDGPVLAGVLARIIELENVLGRYGKAMEDAERLLELTRSARLPLHRAEGLALLAETLVAVGLNEDATDAARQAAALVQELGPRAIEAGTRAARVLCDVGRQQESLALLDAMGEPSSALAGGGAPEGESLVDDPMATIVAVRARAVSKTDASAARELANLALNRTPPLLTMRAARIRLDAALALHEAGADSAARSAVKRGLKALQGSGNKGLKLELLVAMYLAAPDHRVVEAAARTAMRVVEELPGHAVDSFRKRPIIADALARWAKEQPA